MGDNILEVKRLDSQTISVDGYRIVCPAKLDTFSAHSLLIYKLGIVEEMNALQEVDPKRLAAYKFVVDYVTTPEGSLEICGR